MGQSLAWKNRCRWEEQIAALSSKPSGRDSAEQWLEIDGNMADGNVSDILLVLSSSPTVTWNQFKNRIPVTWVFVLIYAVSRVFSLPYLVAIIYSTILHNTGFQAYILHWIFTGWSLKIEHLTVWIIEASSVKTPSPNTKLLEASYNSEISGWLMVYAIWIVASMRPCKVR